MSERNPPLKGTLTLIAMQGHENNGIKSVLNKIEIMLCYVMLWLISGSHIGESKWIVVCTSYSDIGGSLRTLVLGYKCERTFPAGVRPGSPSRDAANWLSWRFGRYDRLRRGGGMIG